jgi:2-desacetyl-2-hydroxyethyl bacteriochlorophyllide A dehydrogenase
MRAVTWRGVQQLRIDEVPPPVCGPADVVVDVSACGICGTDVHAYLDNAWATQGTRIGHEYAGTVAEAGAHVRGIHPGDRVAVNPMTPCGRCQRCIEGFHNLCGQHAHQHPGGFGDQVLVRDAVVDEQLFVLPDSLTMEAATFLEPLSVATRAVRNAGPPLDEPILIFGLGTIGQCVVQVLVAQGAREVIVVDPSSRRIAAALAAGAHEGLNPVTDDVRARLLASRGVTRSTFQDAGAIGSVFECSGALSVLAVALDLARPGASVTVVALFSQIARMQVNNVVEKELRLLGSWAYTPQDCRAAFELLTSGRVDVLPLISHRFGLADITKAFETQRDTENSIKVMVTP